MPLLSQKRDGSGKRLEAKRVCREGEGGGGAEKSGLADARSRVRLIMADYLRHLTARVRAVFIEIFSAIPAGSAQIFMRRELA